MFTATTRVAPEKADFRPALSLPSIQPGLTGGVMAENNGDIGGTASP